MAESSTAELDVSFVNIDETANRAPKCPTKRQKKKEELYRRKQHLPIICKHGRKAVYKCQELTDQEAEDFNRSYFSLKTKDQRDSFILQFLSVQKKKRSNVKNVQGKKPTRNRDSAETQFFIPNYQKTKQRVCKGTFLRILGGLGRKVVEKITKEYMKNGHCTDKRGGDRKSVKFAGRKTLIRNFIKSLRARKSHYSRQKTKRVYLPSEMQSIKNLWKCFLKSTSESAEQVSYRYFYNIFKKEFNIGFGSIKTDTCSFCESHTYKIKNEVDRAKKNELMVDMTIHKKRAHAFYDLVAELREGLQTYSFDHQQNLVLPKVSDQQAYYSRQLYTYNFAVIRNRPDKKITHDNSFIFTWNENDFKKDSSACCSALFHILKTDKFDGIDTVRLCSDACGGQNKNCTLIFIAAHWLQNHAPANVKCVELVFPVRGHSFLPCDRLFGLIEKKIRKKQSIFSPEEYHEIFKEYGQVLKAGKDFSIFDYKECADSVMKRPLPIKIQENKRFFINRTGARGKVILVSGEQFYRSRINEGVKLTKKGKSFSGMPRPVLMGVKVNDLKKKDVANLMTAHCGSDWKKDERFKFLYEFVSNTDIDGRNECENDCEEECDCLDEENHVMRV